MPQAARIRAKHTSAKWNFKCVYPNWSQPAFRVSGPKPHLDPKPDLPQRFRRRCCNDPACAGHFYTMAFHSPQGNSRVTGSRWTHSFTHTHTPCDGHPGFHPPPKKKKLSTQCRLKCSQVFPIPVKFVQWPKSTWLWFQMASSHPAAHYWTTGCFKDRKSWIKTLYHLLPMKY